MNQKIDLIVQKIEFQTQLIQTLLNLCFHFDDAETYAEEGEFGDVADADSGEEGRDNEGMSECCGGDDDDNDDGDAEVER